VPSRPPRTLLELIYARTGSMRQTYQVGETIVRWAMVRDALGRTPFVHEYAAWWKQSERTAWREMARFTKAFPEESNPDRIATRLQALYADTKLDPATALASPSDALLAA
jgi:hypothetical protein